MNITLREISGVVIFDIEGEFLRSGKGESSLSGLVKTQLNSGKRKFIINLENTTFIDSFGVREILASWIQVHNDGGFFKAAINPTMKLHRGLFMHGYHPIDFLYTNVEEALESFEPPKKINKKWWQFWR